MYMLEWEPWYIDEKVAGDVYTGESCGVVFDSKQL